MLTLDERGMVRRVVGTAASLDLASWAWSFEVDGIDHRLPPLASMPASVSGTGPAFDGPLARIQWDVTTEDLDPASAVVTVRWSVENRTNQAVTLGSVVPASWVLARRYRDLVEYRCAAEAPFGVLLRDERASIWLISENPLVRFGIGDTHLDVGFRANLRIAPGETLAGEPLHVVLGPERTGGVVGRCLPQANGQVIDRGGLPNPRDVVLDESEVLAARALLAHRLPRRRVESALADVDWVNALHPEHVGTINHAQDPAAVLLVREQYQRVMNDMEQLGIERIVIDQALETDPARRIPTDPAVGWELHPAAEPIVAEARSRGLRIGLYNGCGNWPQEWDIVASSAIALLADAEPGWKVVLPGGVTYRQAKPTHRAFAPDTGTSPVNCLAHKPFREWFIDAVSATITRHGLSWWGWDIDNAWQLTLGACWAAHHDHGPGATTYALVRAMHEVEAELHRRHPDLWIMNYWGRKQLGPFGLLGCDLNENAYEYVPTWPAGGQIEQMLGPELAAGCYGWRDAELAWAGGNDLRLQYWFNAYDRFLPNHLTYAPFDPTQRALDELVGGIAAGGAIALYDVVPPDLVDVIRGWLDLHREEQQLLALGRPLWGPPRRGGIDGWWHCDGRRALAFLFNPNATELVAELPVGTAGGLTGGGPWSVRRRTPGRGPVLAIGGETFFAAPTGVPVAGRSWAVLEVTLEAGDGGDVEQVRRAPEHEWQPARWSAANLAAHRASLPPMPTDLTRSNVMGTAFYSTRFS